VSGRPRGALVLAALAASLLVAIATATAAGSVAIPLGDLAPIALAGLGVGGVDPAWRPQDAVILLDLRLPRVVAAAVAGAALACAGVLFQGLLRNPLADPYVVGTSGGAALGAALGVLVARPTSLLGAGLVPLGAFFGALAATGLVVGLARVGGRTRPVTLLLAGFAVSVMLGQAVSLLLVASDRLQVNLPRLYGWLLGGVAVNGWGQLAVVGPLAAGAAVAAGGLASSLNALSLGEEAAAHLGVDVERDAGRGVVLGALLTACAVSLSGLVGFVGLVVPHALRLLCGPDHRLLVPAVTLAGASFLVVADLIARTALPPTELPVGIVTALLGGPYFLYLLRRVEG